MSPPDPPRTPAPAVAPGWRTIAFAGVDVDVPAGLVPTDEQGVDGEALTAQQDGLRLTLDASPFRDRLTSYGTRPGFRRWTDTVAGREQVVVAFDDDDGTVLAADLPGAVTATVHVRAGADTEAALQIIRSVIPHRGDTP